MTSVPGGPPWDDVGVMAKCYLRGLERQIALHELFYYQTPEQYARKLDTFAALLVRLHDDTGRLLDVGCGLGELLAHYHPPAGYVGVDVLADFVAAARMRFPEFEFRCMNILETGLSERFGTVVAAGVLGTSPKPIELLSSMARIAERHLLFDYLPEGGSAAAVRTLRTLRRADVLSAVRQHGWHVLEVTPLGSSTEILRCQRVAQARSQA